MPFDVMSGIMDVPSGSSVALVSGRDAIFEVEVVDDVIAGVVALF